MNNTVHLRGALIPGWPRGGHRETTLLLAPVGSRLPSWEGAWSLVTEGAERWGSLERGLLSLALTAEGRPPPLPHLSQAAPSTTLELARGLPLEPAPTRRPPPRSPVQGSLEPSWELSGPSADSKPPVLLHSHGACESWVLPTPPLCRQMTKRRLLGAHKYGGRPGLGLRPLPLWPCCPRWTPQWAPPLPRETPPPRGRGPGSMGGPSLAPEQSFWGAPVSHVCPGLGALSPRGLFRTGTRVLVIPSIPAPDVAMDEGMNGISADPTTRKALSFLLPVRDGPGPESLTSLLKPHLSLCFAAFHSRAPNMCKVHRGREKGSNPVPNGDRAPGCRPLSWARGTHRPRPGVSPHPTGPASPCSRRVFSLHPGA